MRGRWQAIYSYLALGGDMRGSGRRSGERGEWRVEESVCKRRRGRKREGERRVK